MRNRIPRYEVLAGGYQMILSHQYKFIFFCNGKTGTTSIESALEPFQEGGEFDIGVRGLFVPKHVPPAILRACLPSAVWDGYFKFVFVRNPWDWFVSQWKYNASRPSFSRMRGTSPRQRLLRRAKKLFRPQPEPERAFTANDVDLLFEYLKQFRGLPGKEGLYQSNYVYDSDGTQLVDYLGRFETLVEDVDRIRKRIGLDVPLPHLNRTERGDYRAYFTAEGRQRLAKLWAVDVENFDYSF